MNMLPTVRRQLLEAVERRAQPNARASLAGRVDLRLRRRPTAAHFAIAALGVVPFVIAAGALILLGSHRGAPSPPAAAHPETARQQLVDHFGVLRRAQTAADRDSRLLLPPFFRPAPRELGHPAPAFENALRRWGYPKLDRALMRVVSVPRFDARVALEPATWQPSSSSPMRAEGIVLAMRIGGAGSIPPAGEYGTGPPPISVGTLLAHGLALTGVTPSRPVIDGVMVVPDNVAKLTLRPIHILHTPVRLDPSSFGAASAVVHDNVAAYQLRLPTVHSPRFRGSALFGTDARAEVTWFDAAGRVIRRTTTSVDVFVRVVGTRA